MAKLRPARTCRDWQRPWTRTSKRVVKMAYVRGAPDSHIRKFDMGNVKDFKKYEIGVDVITNKRCQIRHNTLEAIRMTVNRYMEKNCERTNFYFKIRVYPHHVIREHAILSGAGADRLSQGMKHAFGRPSGRAARVKEGQPIISIYTYKKFEKFAKDAGRKAKSRLPYSGKIVAYPLKDGKVVETTKVKKKPKKPKKRKEAPKQVVKKKQKKEKKPKPKKPVQKKVEEKPKEKIVKPKAEKPTEPKPTDIQVLPESKPDASQVKAPKKPEDDILVL